jgi:hypothetical protein
MLYYRMLAVTLRWWTDLCTDVVAMTAHTAVYARAVIATSVHRLYILPPGKNSLELLQQYNFIYCS